MFFYTNAYAHKKGKQKTRKKLTFHRSILLEITFHCGMESHIMGSKSSSIRKGQITSTLVLGILAGLQAPRERDAFSLKYQSFFWFDPLLIQVLLIFLSQSGFYLITLKNCSFKTVRAGWRILVDSEFSGTLFNGDNKGCQSRGCVGEPLARISEQCSVSGLGQVRLGFGLGLCQVQVRIGLGLGFLNLFWFLFF